MDYSKIRVLVTEAGGKQSIAMIRGLKELGCHVSVVCSSKHATGYVSNKPDEKILCPCISDHNEHAFEELLKLAASGSYDVIMPIGELGTEFVTRHEDELKKYVKLACAPRESYIKAYNKQITFDTAIENGIPCPYTRHSNQDIEDFLQHCRFPIIIKPRQGLGSIGFHKFTTEQEFRNKLKDPSFNVDDYVVQEFVRFEKRIGTNLFVDQQGNICSAYAVDVLRWFPLDAGAGVLIVTVDAHETLKYAGDLLKALKWQGFANVAFMVDQETGESKLLEINGRIPASIKMAYMCGYNISRQFLELIYDQDVIQYPENDRFDMYIRHLDTDLAWFLKSQNRFKTRPSWFSWKNTKEILYYHDDCKPFFAHLFQQLFHYKSIMKKKQH